jgi:hypothetical protein
MKILPIFDETARVAAARLLAEGFGKRWNRLEQWYRAFDAPISEECGHGYLLTHDDDFQGVVLMFEHVRIVRETKVPFVNISSWYIREPYRSEAPFMLSAVTRRKNAVYTAFASRESVQAIYRALRFRVIAPDVIIVPPIPLLFQRPRTSISIVLGDVGSAGSPAERIEALKEHMEKGFIVGYLIHAGDQVPFAFFPQQKRALLLPLLVYCPQPQVMADALPAVFRRLVARYGAAGLKVPRRDGYERIQGIARPRALYAKGPVPDSEVDLLCSEFFYLRELFG